MEMAAKKSNRVIDYYIRQGDTYYVYTNWVCRKLSREEFAGLLLVRFGLFLNAAGDPVCPVTGLKKSFSVCR
jgi:hypothetical protein